MKGDNNIQWTSSTKHVDIDTGELLNKNEIKKYIIIKTTKYGTTYSNKTKGHIEYTKQYRRNPQGELNLT